MKKVLILGIIIGGIIFGTSVYALTSYLYSANEVSYSPNDNSWNVDSVDKAIDELYTRTKTMMPIPTATKSITSNGNNIDVKNYAKVNVNVNTSSDVDVISYVLNSYSGNGQSCSGKITKLENGVQVATYNVSYGTVIDDEYIKVQYNQPWQVTKKNTGYAALGWNAGTYYSKSSTGVITTWQYNLGGVSNDVIAIIIKPA